MTLLFQGTLKLYEQITVDNMILSILGAKGHQIDITFNVSGAAIGREIGAEVAKLAGMKLGKKVGKTAGAVAGKKAGKEAGSKAGKEAVKDLISKEKVAALREVFAKIAEEAGAVAGKAAGREAALKAVQQIAIETAAKVTCIHKKVTIKYTLVCFIIGP